MSSLHKGAKDLFLAALDQPEAERPAFLADACGGDTTLRAEVESLLAFHADESTGVPSAPLPPADPRPAFAPGFVFANRYRMVTRLGRGGMGDVWRADDLMLETPVALKLIRATTREGRERLLNEVRLARQVTHPAVCRVFDVGEADDEVFYTMEYVKGQDLSGLLKHAGRLSTQKVVDIARQLCAGLGAAHARGVLHRDLKPANVLIDEDGQVRITDFGIAVAAGAPGGHGMAGTPMYMAPEQRIPGAALTPQTDLYALGVVLYELVTGVHPFRGAGRGDTLTPPSDSATDMDPALEAVILRAMSPNPYDRPSSAAAFAAVLPAEDSVTPRAAMPAPRLSWLRPWPLAIAAGVALIAIASMFLAPRNSKALTEQDTIVLADFQNTTDEPLFTGALKVAMAVALEQSPFLKVFPDDRVRETLRLMARAPDTPITRDVAREIAVREHLKATLSGSIATLGRNYVLALEATNAQTGDVMAREQLEITGKEQVLTALGTAASKLRERLGESLVSVRAFDVPLPRATTPSLEALNAYSRALEEGRVSVRVQSIPHLQRALELDPDFALAQALLSGIYVNTGQSELAPAYSKRAYELRDRVSERERFFISWRYFRDALQDWQQGLDLARAWTAAYPREAFAFNSLGLSSMMLGDLEHAVTAFRESIRLDPRFTAPHGNLADSYLALSRFDEAAEEVRQSAALGLDFISIHHVGFTLASMRGDTAGIERYVEAARKTREALGAADWKARAALVRGRFTAAREEFLRSIQEAVPQKQLEWAAQFALEEAEANAIIGRCEDAEKGARRALDWSRAAGSIDSAGRLLGWCGDSATSSGLSAELVSRFPNATLRVKVSAPISDAARALRQGDAPKALQILQAVEPYERSATARLWPAFLRGHAYAALKDTPRAAASFQYVIDHRGEALDSLLYPMALLARARVAAPTDAETARRNYDTLLAFWANADPDLTPLQEARRERQRLQ